MVVMGVWAFILCTGHRWRKTKEQQPWNNTKQISLNRKQRSLLLYVICVQYTKFWVEFWNPLICGQIVDSFGQGKSTFDCQSGNFKSYSSRNHVSTGSQFGEKSARKGKGKGGGGGGGEREPVDKHLRPLFSRVEKLTGHKGCFAPSENRVKWNASLIVNFAKRRWSTVRELIQCRSLAFQEIRPCWLTVVKTALHYFKHWTRKIPREQGESFFDLSWSNCARQAVRLASSVSNLTSSSNERTWNAKGAIMTVPEREAPKTGTKRSTAFDRRQELHLRVFIGRPTRLLPHAKMLLVTILFFLCWVDYVLEGSPFSLSKCDFSRLFHTERSWHTSIYWGFCFWSTGFALWCKSIFFDLFWRVKPFIAAE